MLTTNRWRRWRCLPVLLVAGLLTACAGMGEIDPERTAGAVVVMGFSVEGRPVSELGYYYVFTFADANDNVEQIVKRPRRNDNQIIFDQLAPGDWTLVAYAARRAPAVYDFAGISVRDRPVMLDFPVAEGSIQVLSHQLTVNHERNNQGLSVTQPRMTPLQPDVRNRVDRRIDRMGESWQPIPEPVGTIDEDNLPDSRNLLERLLGN